MSWTLIEAVVWALSALADPVAITMIVIGVLFGMVMGAVPGLGGVVGLTLLIPFTFGFQTEYALLLLIGCLGGVVFGGSIPAIMMNVPGTPPSVITTIDGYPMAEEGRGGVALGASATASVIGAGIGVVFLFLAIPVFRTFMVYLGPPEFMLVIVVGLLTIAYVLEAELLNGLIGIGAGVVMALHGFDSISGGLRFDFGIVYFYSAVPIVILALGLFAISEMIKLDTQRGTIAENPASVSGNPMEGVRAVFREWKLTVVSSIIGIIVGLVPAAGGSVATLFSYARAKTSASDDSQFGKGDIRGVIAPEAANDAKDGGAFLPTVAFAIPGNAVWAIMLGGLLLHGITPGPAVLSDDLNFIFLIVFGLLLANVLTSTIGLSLVNQIVKITTIPVKILVPIIVVTSIFGAYVARNTAPDMAAIVILGILGFGAMAFSVSRIAILFGLILGPLLEMTFLQTTQIAAGDPMRLATRPVFVGIIAFCLIAVAFQLLKKRA